MLSSIDVFFLIVGCISLFVWVLRQRRTNHPHSAVYKFNVFFGTESGTAEQYAYRLQELLSRSSEFEVSVNNLRDFYENLLVFGHAELNVFIVSTHGDGEPPDSARDFDNWLRSSHVSLSNFNYLVFGLGDSGYLQFNEFAKQVDHHLGRLGGLRKMPPFYSDAALSMEADFRAWQISLCQMYGLASGCIDESLNERGRSTFMCLSSVEVEALGGFFTGEPEHIYSYRFNAPPFSPSNPFLATVTVNTELFNSSDRSCRLVELCLSNSGIKYAAGDHIGVCPRNPKELVQRLCARLEVDPEQFVHISSASGTTKSRPNHFPTPCTLRTAFTHYLDLTTPPRFDLIESLAKCTKNKAERAFLEHLIVVQSESKGGTYEEWILAARRNIVELLEDLPSCRPSALLLCRLLPRLQSRFYSVASSSRFRPKRVRLIVKVLNYIAPTGRLHRGVASSFLSELKVGDTVPVYLRRSEFRLPRDPLTPIVMVAAGTGLAPFLGFIQDRMFIRSKGGKLGEAILFYGCRNRTHDSILLAELEEALHCGVLRHLRIAYSRESEQKVYVQHLMLDLAETIWSLLTSKNGYLYVCGDARTVAPGVKATLFEILKKQGSLTSEETEQFFRDLKCSKRCVFDTWT